MSQNSTNEASLDHGKLTDLLLQYISYCKRSRWLDYRESYKFKFAEWLSSRVDFERQTDEEILKICVESQEQIYDPEGKEKGINFILTNLQRKDSFISREDIATLRAIKNGLPEESSIPKSEVISFPKLSVWLGTLIPNRFIPYANLELLDSLAYLFNLQEYPKTGLKGFTFAQSLLKDLYSKIFPQHDQEFSTLIKKIGKEALTLVDKAWFIEDFILFINRRVLNKQESYYWVCQGDNYKYERSENLLIASNGSLHHHRRLKDLFEGDVIVHYSNGDILSVSEVEEEFKIGAFPAELKRQGEALIVRVKFRTIDMPIELMRVREILSKNFDALPTSYSPINKQWGVNQGYLFPFTKKGYELLFEPASDIVEEEFINYQTIEPSFQLNQILFGPPGTGKTFNSINEALRIINEEEEKSLDWEDRAAVKKQFDKRMGEGRIVFTTFHQSMSYEDFIEGIKPQKPEEGEALKYDIEPGIFKSICNTAKTITSARVKVDWNKPTFYKMSLGGKNRPDVHEWCLKNNRIALGYGGDYSLERFGKIKDWGEYKREFLKDHSGLVSDTKFHIQASYSFLNMKENDIVIVSKGNYIIDAIGIVKGPYYFSDQTPIDYYHFRNVEWIATEMNSSPARFFKKNISQMSIYQFQDDDIRKEAFVEITAKEDAQGKPYILIIDEINRGNVSQIFGELITLIEDDKRIGKAEALEVTLPYSKEKFGVPSNLYIIGTMNTADRSVEALDTALRRRFSFKEMNPKPELLTPHEVLWRFWAKEAGNYGGSRESYDESEAGLRDLLGLRVLDYKRYIEYGDQEWWSLQTTKENFVQELKGVIEFLGINLSEVLSTINKRIQKLLDKDHLIGHSYLINIYDIPSLKHAFQNKIIPLLQEYFYGDYGKIGLVLGEGFFENIDTDDQDVFPNFFDYDGSGFSEKQSYHLKDILNIKDDEFKAVINTLIGNN